MANETMILETFGVVRADGTLELDQKLTIPPGRVKVRVEPAGIHAGWPPGYSDLFGSIDDETFTVHPQLPMPTSNRADQ
jgi:hypothetical protein